MSNIETSRPTIEILSGHAEQIRQHVEELIKRIGDSNVTENIQTDALKTAIDNAGQDGLALNNQLAPITRILSQHASIESTSAANEFPTQISLNGTPEQRKTIIDALQPMVTLLNQPQEMLDKLEVERKANSALNLLQTDFMSQAISKTIGTGARIFSSPDRVGTILSETLPAANMDVTFMNHLGSIFTQSQQLTKIGIENGVPQPNPDIAAAGREQNPVLSQSTLNTGNQMRGGILKIITQLFNAKPGLAALFGGDNPEQAARNCVDGLLGFFSKTLATHVSRDAKTNALLGMFRGVGEGMMAVDIAKKFVRDNNIQLTPDELTRGELVLQRVGLDDATKQGRLLKCVKKYCEYKRQNKQVTDEPTVTTALSLEATNKYLAELDAAAASTPSTSPNGGNEAANKVARERVQEYFRTTTNATKHITETSADAAPYLTVRGMNIKLFKDAATTPNQFKIRIESSPVRLLTVYSTIENIANDLHLQNPGSNTDNNPENVLLKVSGVTNPGIRLGSILDRVMPGSATHTKIILPATASTVPGDISTVA